ncbi:hypothetical protein BJY04DRAFT_218235 [Aspergillus karnatakaensis]|uniref:uncharacterized protein n=1 Tax=Aspergillus karnatakaensis TaxID=1810916 RepID=UPI003CCCF39F
MESYILRLPDELLEGIFRSACYTSPDNPNYRFINPTAASAALCLVCRRFYHIALPHLYAEFCVDYDFEDYARKGEAKDPDRVHSSCAQSPSLWPLCRRLALHCNDELSDNETLEVLLDLTKWFSNTQTFFLSNLGRLDGPWSILRSALMNFSALIELDVSGEHTYDMELGKVIETLGDIRSSQIQTLKLGGVSLDENTSVSKRLLRTLAGTASFTTLELRRFLQTPEILEHLVKWPASLETFKLDYTYGVWHRVNRRYNDWSLSTLQPILAIHQTTLRYISISHIDKGGLSGFDMRDFPKLQELRLSEATTSRGSRNPIAEAHLIPNLLAPRLSVFHWDMTLEVDSHMETIQDFAQGEEDFLRAFAREAIKAKCPLRLLKITYTPEGIGLDPNSKYPWDRLDTLDREFQPSGVRLHYNTPTISREEYLVGLERLRKRLDNSARHYQHTH